MTITKNIRWALNGHRNHIALGQTAAQWAEGNLPEADKVLADLGLAAIAQKGLRTGLSLEQVGAELSTYKNPAQRRAWAEGRLLAAIEAIAFAVDAHRESETERAKTAATLKILERERDAARLAERAAWRASGVDKTVPFREARPVGRIPWAS